MFLPDLLFFPTLFFCITQKQIWAHLQYIYPGKLSKANAFRIGNIGQVFPEDVKGLLGAIKEVMEEEKIMITAEPSSV